MSKKTGKTVNRLTGDHTPDVYCYIYLMLLGETHEYLNYSHAVFHT